MTDLNELKCPVCGSRGPIREQSQLLRCTYCKHTDQASQFKQVGPIESIIAAHDANNRAASERTAAEFLAADIDNTGAAGEEIFSTPLDDNNTLTTFYPPDDIVAAVRKIDDYFRIGRGAKEWAYGPIQSRDPDAAPNLASVGMTGVAVGPDITLPVVKRLAAAFQCDVIKPLTREGRAQLVARVLAYLDNGNEDTQHDAAEIVDMVLKGAGQR